MLTETKKQSIIALLLIALMMITRSHHFASNLHLPDASLVVFFLAGFYLRSTWIIPLLMLSAFGIDFIAFAHGISDWCMSPAYVFLVPTYAGMWFSGRWFNQQYQKSHDLHWQLTLPLFASLLVSGSLAFLISNGSFYLLSGRFPEMNWAEYSSRVAMYYLPYMSSVFLYISLAAIIHSCVSLLRGLSQNNSSLDKHGN